MSTAVSLALHDGLQALYLFSKEIKNFVLVDSIRLSAIDTLGITHLLKCRVELRGPKQNSCELLLGQVDMAPSLLGLVNRHLFATEPTQRLLQHLVQALEGVAGFLEQGQHQEVGVVSRQQEELLVLEQRLAHEH